jgi:iron complex outermembrane receptor protein
MNSRVAQIFVRRLQQRALSTVSALALAASAMSVPHAVFAAEQNAASPQAAKETIDEVIVTGSRIVREGYEAPTPLAVVDTAAIENSATSNIAEFVNTMPVFSGSAAPNTGQTGVSSGTAGVSALNLRNLGASRTLVLLDGQRSVGSLLTGVVDINVFPQQLVSRVEVVTGGASSVYGSDAVAGVVNFVLDKEFTGIKGEVSGGVTSYLDDESYRLALTGGFPFAGGRGHVIASGEQVYKAGVLNGPSRDWAFVGTGFVTNPAYTATNGQPRLLLFPDSVGNSNGSPGGIVVSGPLKGTYFGQGGSVHQLVYGDVVFDPSMHGGDWKYTDAHDGMFSLDPLESRQNVFTRVQYDITDNITLFGSAAWGSGRTYGQAWTQFQPGNAASGANAIKIDNAFIPESVRARMGQLGVTTLTIGSFNRDMPSIYTNNTRIVNRHVLGANGKFGAFGKDWTWDAYFQNGSSRGSINAIGVTLRDRFAAATDAVRNTNGQVVCRVNIDTNPANDMPGCVPWNLMGENVNTESAYAYLTGNYGTSYTYQKLVQNVWEATVGGEAFDIWAGPVSVSANFAYRQEKVRSIADANSVATNWFGGNYKPLNGAINVKEAALETVVPLAKDLEWADAWDFNGAVRFTDYSNSGFVVTWKVGTTFAPIPDLKLRVTRSRDIRAPNLNELYQGGTGSQNSLPLDPFNGSTPQYRGIATGFPGLKPEKADTIGVGLVVAPSFIPGLTVSADYWDIQLKDAIGAIGAQATVDLCFGGTRPDLCQFITRAAPIPGHPTYSTIGQIIEIRTTNINIATRNTKGIDLEGSYHWNAEDLVSGWAGDFNLHANATLYLRDYQNPGFPGAVRLQGVGENSGNGPPDWRLTAQLSYNLDPISVSLTMRQMSSGVYNNNYIVCTTGCPTSRPQNETINSNFIKGYRYFDMGFSYRFLVGEETTMDAFLNVRNIANTDPVPVAQRINPFINTAVNSILYDTLGRMFRAGVRFKM